MDFKLINFDIWKQYVKYYVKQYILCHDIYKWIPSEIPWDCSGSVEKVKTNILFYVLSLEQDMFQEDFLSTLYNGVSIASYVSGCGFFYETFHEAIVQELESELFGRLCGINNIEDDENENYDILYDYVTDEMEQEWICNVIAKFDKEKVLNILKEKYSS